MVSEAQPPESEAPPEPVGRRLRAWIGESSTWGELAGVAAVVLGALVVALILFDRPSGTRGPAASISPGVANRLMSLRPLARIPASFDLAGAVAGEDLLLTEGSAVDLTFQVEVPSRALVLEDRARQQLVQLYPPAGRGTALLEAGQRVRVTASDGGPLVITNPPGERRVRLIVFPPEVDPLTIQPTELGRLGSRLTVAEHRYEAVARGESR
jgi:hypothetical protein